jgi:hypothetical protein
VPQRTSEPPTSEFWIETVEAQTQSAQASSSQTMP